MECSQCAREAVVHQAYAGVHRCDRHLRESVEKRVRRRIRRDGLLPADATSEDPETWVIGLSGGKDSVVLTTILAETFAEDPRVELVALTVHEGIEGYRDSSLAACEELIEDLDVTHEVVTYDDEFGVEMDDVAREDPLDMAPCAYCGVFRRDVLARYAETFGADKLLTGHNLDDEAETALMNLFEGDVAQIGKHFDASLGPFGDATTDEGATGPPDARNEPAGMIPRAKPLRDVPEKEVALYARVRDLPVHAAECPHASEAFRGEIQDLLLELEADHPGTRHSIMAGYEELAGLAAAEYGGADGDEGDGDEGPPGECRECGAPTRNEVCRTCELLEAVAGD